MWLTLTFSCLQWEILLIWSHKKAWQLPQAGEKKEVGSPVSSDSYLLGMGLWTRGHVQHSLVPQKYLEQLLRGTQLPSNLVFPSGNMEPVWETLMQTHVLQALLCQCVPDIFQLPVAVLMLEDFTWNSGRSLGQRYWKFRSSGKSVALHHWLSILEPVTDGRWCINILATSSRG